MEKSLKFIGMADVTKCSVTLSECGNDHSLDDLFRQMAKCNLDDETNFICTFPVEMAITVKIPDETLVVNEEAEE